MTVKTVILTGSHLTPAQALGQLLLKHGYRPIYFSLKNSPKFNRHQPIWSLLSLIFLPIFIFKAWRELRRLQAAVVVSFGGYSALPVCLAAKLSGGKLIIHEQTFAAGLTSRLTAGLADKICVSWPESLKFFNKNKTVLTGNPLRQEVVNLKPIVGQEKIIYITGGHQGSRAINAAVCQILKPLTAEFKVYHQFGLNQNKDFWPKTQPENYAVKTWFSPAELMLILKQAAIVISRSGINTVTELAYLQKRAILIPLETAQKNEQLTNARWLESLGLALILLQAELSGDKLWQLIKQALKILPRSGEQLFDRNQAGKAGEKLFRVVREYL